MLAHGYRASTQTQPQTPYLITDLGTLGGAESRAFGLAADADVVGSALRADGKTHAFLSTSVGKTMTDLGTLGGASSVATDINSSGAVVGHSMTALGSQEAFLYTKAGGMISLRTLGGTASDATAINLDGEVVGSAQTTGNTARRAFIYRNGVMTQLGRCSAVPTARRPASTMAVMSAAGQPLPATRRSAPSSTAAGLPAISARSSAKAWQRA